MRHIWILAALSAALLIAAVLSWATEPQGLADLTRAEGSRASDSPADTSGPGTEETTGTAAVRRAATAGGAGSPPLGTAEDDSAEEEMRARLAELRS